MLYVHCGLHKTGSTSIQNSLSSAPRGWLNYLPEGYWKLRQPNVDRIWLNEIGLSAQGGLTILSSEAALGSMSDVYQNALERLQAITDSLYDTDFRVVVYFRQHLPWLESAYSQLIHQGESLTPGEFLTGIVNRKFLQYADFINMMRGVVGSERLIPRIYDGNDVVRDFYSAIDCPPP